MVAGFAAPVARHAATLAVTALNTDRILLGTAVTNVETRHLSVLASAVRTVQEVAGERFRLGLGVGSSATANAGLAHTTGRRLEEAVHQLRALLAGQLVDLGSGRPSDQNEHLDSWPAGVSGTMRP